MLSSTPFLRWALGFWEFGVGPKLLSLCGGETSDSVAWSFRGATSGTTAALLLRSCGPHFQRDLRMHVPAAAQWLVERVATVPEALNQPRKATKDS
eukprot:2881104-Amphidinium_carterae.1